MDLRVSKPLSLARVGLIAGLAGALAMTLSQKAEMAITDREPSATPAEAVEKLVGVNVEDEAEQRLATAVHLGYGATLGVGLAALDRLPEPARSGLFAACAWVLGAGLLTAGGLSKPPTQWDGAQLATDMGHHLVYGAGAGLAYSLLSSMIAERD